MVPQRRLSEGRKGKDVAVAGAEMSDNIQPMDVDVVSTEAMGTRTVSVEGTLADPQRAGSPTDSAFDLEDSDCRIGMLFGFLLSAICIF